MKSKNLATLGVRGQKYREVPRLRCVALEMTPEREARESAHVLWKSSIGKKWLVALTGLVPVGYVIGHMAGNLQIFAGPAQINSYAHFLHSMPATLWVVRVFLIAAFVLHIVTTIKLLMENRAAKPERYARFESIPV